jgi:divinyl chlorophyllide a 8-vinyl-reductase
MRVFMVGATGTIGRATVHALLRHGHEVVCFVRPAKAVQAAALFPRVTVRGGEVGSPVSIAQDGLRGERFDALVSCLASRTGAPRDAWAVDHQAQLNVLQAARSAGVQQVVLLSALCVQKPQLAFQQAKLAFEAELVNSGLNYSIVRATAFFKSLSGQVARVQAGKAYLMFGDGRLTACKPISDDDLADFLAGCLNDPGRHRRILPIGGPGPALTPLQQGEMLFSLLGRTPRFKRVPVGLLSGIVGVLGTLGRVLPPLAAKAELARIGRYYATESMLVWDAAAGRYDADATPSHGTQTLQDHYRALLSGALRHDSGEHAVF